MSELFDENEEDNVLVSEDEVADTDVEDDIADEVEISQETQQIPAIDARRRLESLLEEKRLRDELEDFIDF